FPNGFTPSNIYTSDLARAMETAELAGFAEHNVTADLEEWDYGRAEGRTREQLNAAAGYEWNVWRDGPHSLDETLSGTRVEVFEDGSEITVVNGEGEALEDAAARTRTVIEQVLPALLAGENVLLVAHAHILRILTSQ
ncbi:histidine phosphatase family protein, partial [Bifidobacterium longum]